MNELNMLSTERPGLVAIDNFEQLKKTLQGLMARYEGRVYGPETLALAKSDKKELTRLRKQIDERRKEVKRTYLAPYNEFEAKVKELLALIDAPLDEIKAVVAEADARERAAKREEVYAFFRTKAGMLGSFADQVWNSSAFAESKWFTKTCSASVWQREVSEKMEAAARELDMIRTTGGQYTAAQTERYLNSFDTAELSEYRRKLSETASVAEAGIEQVQRSDEDQRVATVKLQIKGTMDMLDYALELLELAGVECDIVEDDRPRYMRELTEPCFDSFVCFDIETTGTFGAANGDGPAEITEIGAVKVIDGRIVERQDWLCNPGRRIVPQIARLTHITDDMVADAPTIDQVLAAFRDFSRGLPLVGHNIQSSDLHYIERAAKKTGVILENEYFDTYRYARTLQKAQGWANVKLETLSALFGISQPDAHRAWCDAEANVGVYFKLRELQEKMTNMQIPQ